MVGSQKRDRAFLSSPIIFIHSKDGLMARRNYQFEKRQKELAKKKKKEDKRLRKQEKKEAEALADPDNVVEGESPEQPEVDSEESPENSSEDTPEDPVD